MSVRFKTSRTYLETLLPSDSFGFRDRSTVCQASFSVTTLDSEYSHFGLYIHGVEYRKKDGTTIEGSYLPFLLESPADSCISQIEDLAMSDLTCNIEVARNGDSYRVEASWGGTKFAEIALSNLQLNDPGLEKGSVGGEDGYDILAYRDASEVDTPATGDGSFAVVLPQGGEPNSTLMGVRQVWRSSEASVKISGGDWELLPTLHHITSALAEIPTYEVTGAKIVEGTGVPNIYTGRHVEEGA